jgi:hypothetical protein
MSSRWGGQSTPTSALPAGEGVKSGTFIRWCPTTTMKYLSGSVGKPVSQCPPTPDMFDPPLLSSMALLRAPHSVFPYMTSSGEILLAPTANPVDASTLSFSRTVLWFHFLSSPICSRGSSSCRVISHFMPFEPRRSDICTAKMRASSSFGSNQISAEALGCGCSFMISMNLLSSINRGLTLLANSVVYHNRLAACLPASLAEPFARLAASAALPALALSNPFVGYRIELQAQRDALQM